jgi:hypothetical protein
VSGTTKEWYVVAREGREANFHVDVFGPFISEIDARAFALDVASDDGWEYVEPEYMTHEAAENLATKEILWPYSEPE